MFFLNFSSALPGAQRPQASGTPHVCARCAPGSVKGPWIAKNHENYVSIDAVENHCAFHFLTVWPAVAVSLSSWPVVVVERNQIFGSISVKSSGNEKLMERLNYRFDRIYCNGLLLGIIVALYSKLSARDSNRLSVDQ